MKSKNIVLAGLAGVLFSALSASRAAASPMEEAAQAGELSMQRLAQFHAAVKPFRPAPAAGGIATRAADPLPALMSAAPGATPMEPGGGVVVNCRLYWVMPEVDGRVDLTNEIIQKAFSGKNYEFIKIPKYTEDLPWNRVFSLLLFSPTSSSTSAREPG